VRSTTNLLGEVAADVQEASAEFVDEISIKI
jgi:hypothetical protein